MTRLQVMVAATIIGNIGRDLVGQATDAVFVNLKVARPLTVGDNCARGAQ